MPSSNAADVAAMNRSKCLRRRPLILAMDTCLVDQSNRISMPVARCVQIME